MLVTQVKMCIAHAFYYKYKQFNNDNINNNTTILSALHRDVCSYTKAASYFMVCTHY